MNRQQRAHIPSAFDVLDRVSDVLQTMKRQAHSGIVDHAVSRQEIQSLILNVERLEGSADIPCDTLKEAVSSLTSVLNSIPQTQGDEIEEVSRYDDKEPNPNGTGRDRLNIDVQKLHHLVKMGFSVKKIAEDGMLGGKIHPNTLYQRLKEEDLSAHKKFTQTSDDDIKRLIENYNRDHPNSGAEEICASLKAQGIYVQRDKCRKLLCEVDPTGTATRWAKTIHRRHYSVPNANSLWHVDTHHSLIRWGIVVHGCIDGYSRLVTYLRGATSNTSKAAASFFVESTKMFGVPSRLRADHGTEFVDVGRFLLAVNGEDRGSFLTGPSVHNQRIERLWRDVFVKVLNIFYKLFSYLEEQKLFDIDNPTHKYVLQYVFTPRVDNALKDWQNTHNQHRLRTEHNQTPQMLWMQSLLSCNPSSRGVSNAIEPQQEKIDNAIQELNIPTNCSEYLKPRVLCPLTEADLSLLDDTVDVLRPSTSHGLDIFGEVMTFVTEKLNSVQA